MAKITEKELKAIDKTRGFVKHLSDVQDAAFNELIEELELEDDSIKKDWLFDYVYNNGCSATLLLEKLSNS